MRGLQYVSSTDLQSAYWQIGLTEEAKKITAFVTQKGTYTFERMPFGLRNAPTTMSRAMAHVFAHEHGRNIAIYMDDVVIHSKSWEDHKEAVGRFLGRLKEVGLKINCKKCVWGADTICFLGYLVCREGTKPDPKKIKVVLEYPTPKSVKNVRSFLGMASYYRRFIQGFAIIANPINGLLKKEKIKEFIWTLECDKAFEELKTKLTEAPVLIFPDLEKQFIVAADASTSGIGGCISQIQEGKEHPIAYCSRALSPAEKKYAIMELECLALVFTIRTFNHYLWGQHFLLVTDHMPLKTLNSQALNNKRIARWALFLSSYSFETTHKKGTTHGNVDGLSRAYEDQCFLAFVAPHQTPELQVNASSELEVIGSIDIKKGQTDDDECQEIIQELKVQGSNPEKKDLANQLNVDGTGLLWAKSRGGKSLPKRLFVPKVARKQILNLFHDSVWLGGHLGIAKTFRKIAARYYWPSLRKDVEEHVNRCSVCEARKRPKQYGCEPMIPAQPTLNVCVKWYCDIIGPLKQTEEGYTYCFYAVESLSRWVETQPMLDSKSETVARCLMECIFSRWETPKVLVTDGGRNLKASVDKVCEAFGVEHVVTSPYHQQANQAESSWRTFQTMLACYLREDHREWSKFITPLTTVLRITPHEVTKLPPYTVMTGREFSLQINKFQEIRESFSVYDELLFDSYYGQLIMNMEKAVDIAVYQSYKAQEVYKMYYDAKVNQQHFEVGQIVSVKLPMIPGPNQSKKLGSEWVRHVIISVDWPNVLVKNLDNQKSKPRYYHFNLVKPSKEKSQPILNTPEPQTKQDVGIDKNIGEVKHQYNLRPRK